jgi:hypothetical protein
MVINVSKSACLRIGPRFNQQCASLTTIDGISLPWVKSIRYLGVEITSSRSFKCCYDGGKKSFYRAFNAIFGKIGRIATENVIINLVKTKCLPLMLYGLEACPVNKRDLNALEFPITRIFMKMFCTTSISVVNECQSHFNFSSVRTLIENRKYNFLQKFAASQNSLCYIFETNAKQELVKLKTCIA